MNINDTGVIFCFTGTGNSLKVAKDIASALGTGRIVHMRDANAAIDLSEVTYIGFVYPVYFLELPGQVRRFVQTLKLPPKQNCYIFSIATYANMPGNALPQMNHLLKSRGNLLGMGGTIKMADNAIAYYQSKSDFKKLENTYSHQIKQIISDISLQKKLRNGINMIPLHLYNSLQVRISQKRDRHFTVSSQCSGCGLCTKICPAHNITIKDKIPSFNGQCEQCMGCIQICPYKAIDYKEKCSNRPRYRHPQISVKEIVALNS